MRRQRLGHQPGELNNAGTLGEAGASTEATASLVDGGASLTRT